MVFLDALTLNKPEIFVGSCAGKIDEKTGELKDDTTRTFGQATARSLRQIRGALRRQGVKPCLRGEPLRAMKKTGKAPAPGQASALRARLRSWLQVANGQAASALL